MYTAFILFIALGVFIKTETKKLSDDIYYIKSKVYDINERLKEKDFKLSKEKDL
jgi:hypothetical protein